MTQARVTNVAVLADFRAALATFATEARQALGEVQTETHRAMDWITNDRPAYWRSEVRRSAEAVARAKDDLAHSKTYKRIDSYVPSCIEEKKALAAAKHRQTHAEEKLETVKRWGHTAQQAVDEFKGPIQQLMAVLDGDIPRAMALLDRMSDALARYAALGTPAAIQWEDLVKEKAPQSVARGGDEMANPSGRPAEGEAIHKTEAAAS